jgi:DNA topoisomerase II
MPKKTVEQKYQKKTQIEHILTRPDTYIGDIISQDETMWIYDHDPSNIIKKIIKKEINYVPGLYKIIDEILVNASDQTVEDETCDTIRIEIDKDLGQISVWNNGVGIPVVIHEVHKQLIPELIFGELLTSSNYDDKDKRVTGGRNGYGAKLTNIFSVKFEVETACNHTNNDGKVIKKYFYQVFENNLSRRSKPVVTDLTGQNPKTYTKISFIPDFKKFGVDGLTDDFVSLIVKRAYDIAACTYNKVKVYVNNTKLEINNFKKYIGMYYDDENMIYEEPNDRWKIGLLYIPDNGYEQISYVNGINTYNGGTHVNYVVDNIVKQLDATIKKKEKNIKIKPSQIKDNIVIFIDATIENPAFASQIKEELKTKASSFGTTCELSDKFIDKLVKSGIVEQVISLAKFKQESGLKKTDGKKTKKVRDIPKLEDANEAGTRNSYKCKLILTEGDSAKTLIMGARAVIGNDFYGVFPLRGKLLNVREATAKQLLENEEIKNIKKILGLQQGKQYTNVKQLRYGGIIILTDADVDGYHIRGLIINFIHYFWPTLMMTNEFIYTLSTPIVAVTKGKRKKAFYNLTEYQNWKKKNGSKGWTIKYYKGLGTSTREDGKEYFADMDNKLTRYIWDRKEQVKNEDINNHDDEHKDEENDDDIFVDINKEDIENAEDADEDNEDDELNGTEKSNNSLSSKASGSSKKSVKRKNYAGKMIEYDENDTCSNSITLAFEKKRADDRKLWVSNYDKNLILDHEQNINVSDMVNKELIHFSVYDNIRSIPSVIDGLKPGQRKILFSCLKRKLYAEIKVSQLSGYVAEHSAYHHGEQSLAETIIGMAQDFVGSNNINLLFPAGQFGSRLMGGKDYASPRYIFTYLSKLTSYLFREEDNPILTYLDDDGVSIEPNYYVPIIPMLLVNGTKGIGTGYSTDIPCYNPLDIISNLYLLMEGAEMNDMTPWYKNFTGTIDKVTNREFTIKGVYNPLDDDTMEITELPVGTWTTPYKTFLESFEVENSSGKTGILLDIKDHNDDEHINFMIQFVKNKLLRFITNDTIDSKLKLVKKLGITNFHAFDKNEKMKKYDSPLEIIKEFYQARLQTYVIRKKYQLKKLLNDLELLRYKAKFVNYVITKKIRINNKPKNEVIEKIEEYEFPKLSTDVDDLNKSYNYLTDMKWTVLTKEEIEQLENKRDIKQDEYNALLNKTELDIWKDELAEFKEAYIEWYEEDHERFISGINQDKKKIKKVKEAKKKKKPKSKTTKPKKVKET